MWPREQLVETDVKDTVIIIIIINTIITIIIKDVKDTVITLPNIINTILVSLLIKEVSKNVSGRMVYSQFSRLANCTQSQQIHLSCSSSTFILPTLQEKLKTKI